jgi:hypothetical protein
MKRALIFFTLLAAACSKAPEPKGEAKATSAANDTDVSKQKKSLEEAADEAAKLVEEDAKAEIDALQSAEPIAQPTPTAETKEK